MTLEEVFTQYVLDVKNHPLVFQDFIDAHVQTVISNLQLGDDIPNLCSHVFHKVAERHNVPVASNRVDWKTVALEFLKFHVKKKREVSSVEGRVTSNASAEASLPSTSGSPIPSPSPPTTTATKHKLTVDERANVKSMYQKLDEKKMWKLSTGTLVEKKMEKLALASSHEHPCHSIIFDPEDVIWQQHFTEDEIHEIKNYTVPKVRPLPKALDAYLKEYAGLTNLDAIRNINKQHNFHPLEDPELHWMETTITKALDILYYRYLSKQRTETELLKHVWSFIDTLYYFGEIEATSGETSSKATSKRVNSSRALSAIETCARKQVGVKLDLLFATEVYEIGAAESGRVTDQGNTKTLIESGFKLPKVLKDMFVSLLSEAPSCARQVKTCGFTLAGISMMPHILDSPAGYVCRMNRAQRWLHFPTSEHNFVPRIDALLRTVYSMKATMVEVLDLIDNEGNAISFGAPEPPVAIPPCFMPSKKRKQSGSSSSTPSKQPRTQGTSDTSTV